MSVNEAFDWNFLYKLIEKDVKKESDIIVAIIHWCLTKRAGFSCSTGNETLPDSWNENSIFYALHYVHEENEYKLMAFVSNDTITVFLLRIEPVQSTHIVFNIKDTVKAIHGEFSTLVPEVEEVVNRLERDLFEPITGLTVNTDSSSTHTSTPEPEEDEADQHSSTSCGHSPRRKRRCDGEVECRLDVKIVAISVKEDTETDESSLSSAKLEETISLRNSYAQPERISRHRSPSTIPSVSSKSFSYSSPSSCDSKSPFPSPPRKIGNSASSSESEESPQKNEEL